MKKLSLLMTLVMLVSLFGVASPAPVAADPIPGRYIQIPVIQVSSGWETWIQVQNVGFAPTKFALLLFGYSGEFCGPQCKRPAKVELSGWVEVGAAWTYKLASANTVDCAGAPFSPRSGILVSLSPAQAAAIEFGSCTGARDAVFFHWLNRTAAGQPAAVSVNRIQTGATGLTPRAASYTGIYGWMEGMPDPRTGAWMYYAPQLFDTFSPAGWSSRLWIQNSGDECTSLEIWFMKQQDCLKARIQQVLALCPGETIWVDPEMPGFLGSAWIRASQPLGVIVDEYNANGSIFMSYRGMPAAIWLGEVTWSMGDLFNFAPLIYREYNGWNAGVVVQNLSSVYNALVKVYFIDNSGDIIDTIVDWICPRGSQTFYLPAINNLPGMYVGQARVESQNWWGPGDPPVDAPTVLSVVNLVNYNTGQGAAYNTFPKHEVMEPDWPWWEPWFGPGKWTALPFLAKDKRDPYEPTGTKWTSEIAMTNLDMIPGVSVWRIDFFDQNGLLYSLCQTLNEKQVDYIKLGNIGIIPPGWLGSALISWQCSTVDPNVPHGRVGHLGVVVVEKASGYPSGDLTKVYEGFPLWYPPRIPAAVECPECDQLPGLPPSPWGLIVGWVTDKETGLPLAGATVMASNCNDFAETTTDADGFYAIEMECDEVCSTWIFAGAEGYTPEADSFDLHCGDMNFKSFELHTTPRTRVLFYYGNGGVGPATEAGALTDYYKAKAWFEDLGFYVDYTDVWPTDPDLDEYRTIFLLAPGHTNDAIPGPNFFTPGQLSQLDLFLRSGGRLVVMTDHSTWTGQGVENDLLTKLIDGVIQFKSQSIPDNLVNQITNYRDIMDGVAVLDFDQDTGSTVAAPAVVLGRINASHATNPNEIIIAAFTPPSAGAGYLVTIGDLNWMDDSRWMNDWNWPADNENLLFNLVQ